MIVHDLFELRRNPEQNPRENVVDFLRKYKDNPKAYLHTAPINKVGIYPKSTDSHDSPVGIYAYHLVDIWENTIQRWNSGDYKRGLEFLPYHGGDHVFVLESDINPDFPGSYTSNDLRNDLNKLKSIYGLSDERIKRIVQAAKTNQNFVNNPAGYLWGATKSLVAGTYEFDAYTPTNGKKWNALLRSLGYVGFNDPGYGLIHGAEHQQALFLTTQAFTVIDSTKITNSTQKIVTIGDKKYKGGRLPKNLYMAGFDSVFFLNNDPEDFSGVRTWTVGSMGLRDFSSFARFVPWNSIGIVDVLSFGNAANSSYEDSEVRRFFQLPIPKNIKVKTIYVGGRYPAMLMKYIPENFPVDEIKISQLSSDSGINGLPEAIQKKVVIQPLR